MPPDEFTIEDLKIILHEAAGEVDGENVDVGVTTMDTDFVDLGYESLALLEAGLRIERKLGIRLDDTTMFDSTTPRALLAAVNAHLFRRW